MTARRLILITDPAYADDVIVRAVEAAAAVFVRGAFAVQLRDKVLRDAAPARALAVRIRDATARAGAAFIVNGDAALARDVGADGVHLGGPPEASAVASARRMCGARAWISGAAHSDADVRAAIEAQVDAVLVSPIFDVPGKGPPRGLGALDAARSIAGSHLALYALGGVAAANAARCIAAGATGVAVIRALLGAEDPHAAACALRDALNALDAAPSG